jgi:hypothetical protein
MAYIILNGKRYRTAERAFKAAPQKAQQINTTIGGKTLSQTFGYTANRWEITILVELTPTDANYGSWANLLTAYGLNYAPYTDVFGVSQGDVFFEGELPQVPNYALVDTAVPFTVDLKLRRRQT